MMARDFTSDIYKSLICTLLECGYTFQTFNQFIINPKEKVVILRHDVDRMPCNAMNMARIENALGVSSSYYFRCVPASWDKSIVQKISFWGHEVGYHYDDVDAALNLQVKKKEKKLFINTRLIRQLMDITYKRNSVELNTLIDLAYESFCKNLTYFRKYTDIKTICMHGSPMSKYDNRMIWTKYDYKSLGLIGEPYFDIDFSEVAYYTDTGHRWDGEDINVRDKPSKGKKCEKRFPKFRSTHDIVKAVKNGRFPEKAMLTIHPQRWNDGFVTWVKEWLIQNIKNTVKCQLVKKRRRRAQ